MGFPSRGFVCGHRTLVAQRLECHSAIVEQAPTFAEACVCATRFPVLRYRAVDGGCTSRSSAPSARVAKDGAWRRLVHAGHHIALAVGEQGVAALQHQLGSSNSRRMAARSTAGADPPGLGLTMKMASSAFWLCASGCNFNSTARRMRSARRVLRCCSRTTRPDGLPRRAPPGQALAPLFDLALDAISAGGLPADPSAPATLRALGQTSSAAAVGWSPAGRHRSRPQ